MNHFVNFLLTFAEYIFYKHFLDGWTFRRLRRLHLQAEDFEGINVLEVGTAFAVRQIFPVAGVLHAGGVTTKLDPAKTKLYPKPGFQH